jgi:two-component system nitrate/nitrite response regulator NarL
MTSSDPSSVTRPSGSRLRVLIVDDHAEFLASASDVLADGGFDVVGVAGDGASALAEAPRLRPALVVLDVHLPDLDGFAVAERLAALEPAPAVVLVSSRPAGSFGSRLDASPALGFVDKARLDGPALMRLLG